MAKLSHIERVAHKKACDLLKNERLSFDEKLFVLENWHEGAEHMNGEAGAFFTPRGLAFDFRLEIVGSKIIDLCAGIGGLAFHAYHSPAYSFGENREIICVEINPAYVEVGKKILPEATWVCGDVTDLDFLKSLGHFDCAISNPPFGKIKGNKTPKYSGAEFEYKVIELSSYISDYGVFIIPQSSAPFTMSGVASNSFAAYEPENSKFAKYLRFEAQTGIRLDPNCGLDTSQYIDAWKGVSPVCEIVLADFEELRQKDNEQIAPVEISAMQYKQLSFFEQYTA